MLHAYYGFNLSCFEEDLAHLVLFQNLLFK